MLVLIRCTVCETLAWSLSNTSSRWHVSHFKYVLTESCRYALMDQLNNRVNCDTEDVSAEIQVKKRMRKDMKGITPMVDTRATLAIVNHKIKEKYEDGVSQWWGREWKWCWHWWER